MSSVGILLKRLARFGEKGFGHFDVCGPALPTVNFKCIHIPILAATSSRSILN